MRTPAALAALVVLATVSCALAAPENPRVSLRVKDATFAEAARALSEASGIRLEVPRTPPGRMPLPFEPALAERSSFDWTNTTFAAALRQLCESYGLTPWQERDRYTFTGRVGRPIGKPLAGPVSLPGGHRVQVTDVRFVQRDRSGAEAPAWAVGFESSFDLGEGLVRRQLAGVSNLRARDDRDTMLQAQSASGFPQRFYPDQWAVFRKFLGLHPAAKKIVSLEGDLLGSRVRRPVSLEVPLGGAPAPPARSEGITAEVVQFRPDAPAERRFEAGPRLLVRVGVPDRPDLRLFEHHAVPVLKDAAGELHGSLHASTKTRPQGGKVVYEVECGFEPLPEKPAAAVFNLLLISPPEKLLSFRITDIPLPGPVPAPPQPEKPAEPIPAHPYLAAGGGSLVSRVEGDPGVLARGKLAFGLRRDGSPPGGLRWLEAPIVAGTARLANVKPGVYRVRRLFRPAGGATPASPTGEEIRVRVVAGQSLILPPLRLPKEVRK